MLVAVASSSARAADPAGLLVAGGAAAAGSNLVANGGFEQRAGDRPAAWDLPDGLGVQWAEAPGAAGAKQGCAIRLDTRVSEIDMARSWARAGLTNDWHIPKPAGNAIADTYGLSYYSAAFPVVSGVVYRVRCDTLGPGGWKVWVRGYGQFRGRLTRRYEAVMTGAASPGAWTNNALVFHPTRHRPDVTEMKVMLYAYYPAGVYWFDNVVVEPVAEQGGADSPTR
jgi:hypothetical protein